MGDIDGAADQGTKVVLQVEGMLADSIHSARSELWRKQSIFRLPEWIKDRNSKAYQPQFVSLGPFHHGDPNLRFMEEHKCRALVQLVKRSGKPLRDFIAAVQKVAEKLEAAYGKDLGDKWRGENRHNFVKVMVTDGCFLLELILKRDNLKDYSDNDPIFGTHGRLYIWPVILSDMLLMENQLPLLLLRTLLAVELAVEPENHQVNKIGEYILGCVGQSLQPNLINGRSQGLHPVQPNVIDCRSQELIHPLDIYYKSLVQEDVAHQGIRPCACKCQKASCTCKYEKMPSAVELHEAGIHFSWSKTGRFLDVRFEHGVLHMPMVRVDDYTERLFLNLMAFERLHAGGCNVLTEYVIFLDNIIDTAKDVEVLSSNEILQNMLGCNEKAAKLFNGTLPRGTVLCPASAFHKLQCDVKDYCKEPLNKWRSYLIRTYIRNPWKFISVIAAAILLAATLMQTVYTVVPFYKR